MTMKNHAKFEKELTCRFKIETLKRLKNLNFDGSLLTKVYI